MAYNRKALAELHRQQSEAQADIGAFVIRHQLEILSAIADSVSLRNEYLFLIRRHGELFTEKAYAKAYDVIGGGR